MKNKRLSAKFFGGLIQSFFKPPSKFIFKRFNIIWHKNYNVFVTKNRNKLIAWLRYNTKSKTKNTQLRKWLLHNYFVVFSADVKSNQTKYWRFQYFRKETNFFCLLWNTLKVWSNSTVLKCNTIKLYLEFQRNINIVWILITSMHHPAYVYPNFCQRNNARKQTLFWYDNDTLKT